MQHAMRLAGFITLLMEQIFGGAPICKMHNKVQYF